MMLILRKREGRTLQLAPLELEGFFIGWQANDFPFVEWPRMGA